MYILCTTLFIFLSSTRAIQYYDSLTGNQITQEEYYQHKKSNTSFWCTNAIEPCVDPHEARRTDGSCNNPRHPSRGSRHSPLKHLIPLVFDKGYDVRKSVSGGNLPLSRVVRTTLLAEGRAPDSQFTHLVTYMLLYVSADVLSFHDTVNFVLWSHCCSEKGKSNPQCIDMRIPDNDPTHRYSNHRCYNLTQPWTFQSVGCLKKNSIPHRVVTPTPFLDLSQLYNEDPEILQNIRMFSGGLLKYEVDNGSIFPPSYKDSNNFCKSNKKPQETRCHNLGDDTLNGIFGTNLFTIWFLRHHNHIATELARVNPCWSDDKLFHYARDINIATAMQIYFYELNPLLLGRQNLYQDSVLSPSPLFRDIYNESVIPQTSLEYGFVLRWAHTIQEGIVKMYDTEGNYIKSINAVDLTLRTGYLAIDNNFVYITQGAFRQPAGKIDDIVDPDIAERGLGGLQEVSDITASDIEKNRRFGIAPYVQYRKYCFGEIINTFEDLTQAIDPEKILLLKEIYKEVEDIDLLAGMWLERAISGARAPATFYCLVTEQLRRFIISDRHWYERKDRPYAFSLEQLLEIRKSTIARLLCDVGDKVTKIQPIAFLIPGPGNEIRNCEEIPKVNFNAWKEESCKFNL